MPALCDRTPDAFLLLLRLPLPLGAHRPHEDSIGHNVVGTLELLHYLPELLVRALVLDHNEVLVGLLNLKGLLAPWRSLRQVLLFDIKLKFIPLPKSALFIVGALLAPYSASQFTPEQSEVNNKLGWAIAGLTLANVLVNEMLMVWQVL